MIYFFFHFSGVFVITYSFSESDWNFLSKDGGDYEWSQSLSVIVRVIVVQTQRTVRVIYSGSLEPETVTVVHVILYYWTLTLKSTETGGRGDWTELLTYLVWDSEWDWHFLRSKDGGDYQWSQSLSDSQRLRVIVLVVQTQRTVRLIYSAGAGDCYSTAVLCCYCYTTRLWLFQITEITRKAVSTLTSGLLSVRLLLWRVLSLACCREEPALWRLLSWTWREFRHETINQGPCCDEIVIPLACYRDESFVTRQLTKDLVVTR